MGLNEKEMEIVHKIKKMEYKNYLNNAKINEDLFNILESLKNQYHIALVTTASKKNAEEILEYFNKKDIFEICLYAENVKNKKPNPEGFIKAMNYFNIKPENTLIFEDSDVGIEAGIRSGSKVFKIEKF